MWWVALERVVAQASRIEAEIGGAAVHFDTETPAAKQAAFDRLHDWLRGLPSEADLRREISALCPRHGVDETAICRELCMSWDELQPFADDPLISIGAHTITPLQSRPPDRRDRRATRSPPAAPGSRDALQRPVATFRLSLWRQGRRRRPRIRAGPRGRLQDRGDDTAGHDISRKRAII